MQKVDIKEEYKDYTLGLALFDALPVIFFLMSGLVIWSMYGSPVFLAGVIACFAGGSCKVLWKLIVVLRGKDYPLLTKAFRILMFGSFGLMILAVIISAIMDMMNGPVQTGAGTVAGNPGSGSTLSGLWRGLSMMPASLFFIAGFAGMCFMGYLGSHMDSSARSNWIEEITNALAQLAILIGVIIVYFGMYYHASDKALDALTEKDPVSVAEIEEGYYFDGPGTDSALVFYPGAKVEAEAYAPLMRKISEKGVDCYLCSMPLNFAMLGSDQAKDIREKYDGGDSEYTGEGNEYSKWMIAGHSLGGVAASMAASEEADDWEGIIYLASYPTDRISVPQLSMYGTEDEVLNAESYEKVEEKGLWPDDFTEIVIKGGNHAQFGDYGAQKGDGEAAVSSEEQQEETAEAVVKWIREH